MEALLWPLATHPDKNERVNKQKLSLTESFKLLKHLAMKVLGLCLLLDLWLELFPVLCLVVAREIASRRPTVTATLTRRKPTVTAKE
jgi:hypothetical protein